MLELQPRIAIKSAASSICVLSCLIVVGINPAFSQECVLWKDLFAESSTDDEIRNEKREVMDKGNVFVFRHSNKCAAKASICADWKFDLAPSGIAEAYLAFKHFYDIFCDRDEESCESQDAQYERVTVYQKIDEEKPRIGETRELMMLGFPGSVKKREIGRIENWTKKELSSHERDGHNLFVFVDSVSLKSLGKFACLEGVILEIDDDGSIETCYRLFPSEWADPVGAELPPWVTDPKNFDHSGQCEGSR